jgi:hypothetical protein
MRGGTKKSALALAALASLAGATHVPNGRRHAVGNYLGARGATNYSVIPNASARNYLGVPNYSDALSAPTYNYGMSVSPGNLVYPLASNSNLAILKNGLPDVRPSIRIRCPRASMSIAHCLALAKTRSYNPEIYNTRRIEFYGPGRSIRHHKH